LPRVDVVQVHVISEAGVMLSIALIVTGSGCARVTRSEGAPSPRAVPETIETLETIEQLCHAYVELARHETPGSKLEAEVGPGCLAALEQARERLAERPFDDLTWCASMARSTASFQACLDANWDNGPFVAASVTPANFTAPTRSRTALESPTLRVDYSELSEDQKAELAKQRYLEAEALAAAGDWVAALPLYEEAYYLVPGKHGFAHKVGVAAFAAGDCDKANAYLRHFLRYGDPDKNADKFAEAESILGEISISGC
jgi:hypothetical protein